MEQDFQNPEEFTITVIGLGLIGGTFAFALKDHQISHHIIGVDKSQAHIDQALEVGFIDEALPMKEAIQKADLILLTVPVDVCVQIIPDILDEMNENQILMDLGSTKHTIVEATKGHPLRRRYLPAHPMWGTEFSGPLSARRNVLSTKNFIICNPEDCDKDVVTTVANIIEKIGMPIFYMDSEEHDIHLAYVSHVSHVVSFALANTVLEKEKEEKTIFDLASSGFDSTVRLAKSSATTWLPIFINNKENLLDVLNEHITQTRKFKSALEKENWEYLEELILQSNKIIDVLKKKNQK